MGAMGHVQSDDIHTCVSEFLQHGVAVRRGSNGANNLGFTHFAAAA